MSDEIDVVRGAWCVTGIATGAGLVLADEMLVRMGAAARSGVEDSSCALFLSRSKANRPSDRRQKNNATFTAASIATSAPYRTFFIVRIGLAYSSRAIIA
jgi:hypothetical protein